MKHIMTLSLTLAFLMVLPLCYAAVGDKSIQTKPKTDYTAEQVDSIVSTRVDEAVKSAVMRELNMELIDLKEHGWGYKNGPKRAARRAGARLGEQYRAQTCPAACCFERFPVRP